MFDASSQALPLTAIIQPSRPFTPTVLTAPAREANKQDDPYARGLADGEKIAAAAFDADRIALQKLVASANALRSETNDEVGALIGETVLRLVDQIIGEVVIDTAFLEQQVRRATELMSEADAARTIWLNPADHALLSEAEFGLVKKIDPVLQRGNLRIDCSDGWIEHQTAFGIEKLGTLLNTARPKP